MSVAAFIASQRADHAVPHALCCRALGVSESWFYKWRDRPPTPRRERREQLAGQIKRIFHDSRGSYGSPRVHAELAEAGWRVSVNTVAAVMAELGLVARPKKRRRWLTRPDSTLAPAPDLLGRDFTAAAPNRKWCGDLTEIPTEEGKLYLASVEDLYSGRMLGYALGERHDAELVRASLVMAVATRGGPVPGVIFHSDRGSEYTSTLFRSTCARLGVIQSMGRVGSALDNAAAESFFSTMEHELLSRRRFTSRCHARAEITNWIEFYNTRRRHSRAGGRSPVNHELAARTRARAA